MRSEFEARRDIVEVGRRVWDRGYVAANDGNLSVRVGERVLITPTGRSKGFLKPDEIVVVSATGQKLSGGLEPTSELSMHLFVYRERPDISAVVHAHPPKATGFAVAGVALGQCILPEVVLTLGQVPLAGYATPSTEEVVQSVRQYVSRFNAMLLMNHGVLTLGSDLLEAYYRLETVEHFAEISLVARSLGGAAPLSSEDVRKLLKVREKLGLPSAPDACLGCGACDGVTSGAKDDAGQDEEAIVRAVLDRLKGVGTA